MTDNTADRLWRQGRRVRRARRMIDLTQEQLAEKVSAEIGESISHNIISQIEKGKRDIWAVEMDALEGILGKQRSWIQGIDPDEWDRDRVNPRYRNSVVDNHSTRSLLGLTTYRPLAAAA